MTFFDKALTLSNTYHISQAPTLFGIASEASVSVCLVCLCVCVCLHRMRYSC